MIWYVMKSNLHSRWRSLHPPVMRFDATYNIFGIYEHQDGAVLVFVGVTKCFVFIANTDGSPLHSADELVLKFVVNHSFNFHEFVYLWCFVCLIKFLFCLSNWCKCFFVLTYFISILYLVFGIWLVFDVYALLFYSDTPGIL